MRIWSTNRSISLDARSSSARSAHVRRRGTGSCLCDSCTGSSVGDMDTHRGPSSSSSSSSETANAAAVEAKVVTVDANVAAMEVAAVEVAIWWSPVHGFFRFTLLSSVQMSVSDRLRPKTTYVRICARQGHCRVRWFSKFRFLTFRQTSPPIIPSRIDGRPRAEGVDGVISRNGYSGYRARDRRPWFSKTVEVQNRGAKIRPQYRNHDPRGARDDKRCKRNDSFNALNAVIILCDAKILSFVRARCLRNSRALVIITLLLF